MKIKTFILTFLLMMMSSPILFGQSRAGEIEISSAAELKAVIDALTPGSPELKVYLDRDVEVQEQIKINEGVKLSIDLNNFRLTSPSDVYIFKNLGELTIEDKSIYKKGIVESKGIANGSATIEGVLNIKGGRFNHNGTAGAIVYNYEKGVANIEGGTFVGGENTPAIINKGVMTIAGDDADNRVVVMENGDEDKTITCFGGSTLNISNAYIYGADIKLNVGATLNVGGNVMYVKAAVGVMDGEDFVTNAIFGSLKDAAAEASNGTEGNVVKLLYNTTESEIVTISGAITINGDNKTLTSTATRAINVDVDNSADGKKVVINNLNIATTNNTERAINVIQQPSNVELNDVTAEGFKYTINVAATGTGSTITTNGGKYSGYAAVNITTKATFTAKGTEFVGINDASEHPSNSFAVIAVNDSNPQEVKIDIDKDSKITAIATNSNKQFIFMSDCDDSDIKIAAELFDVNGEISDNISADIIHGDIEGNKVAFRSAYSHLLIDQGYAVSESAEDGMISVDGFVVATIGEQTYTSLAAALEAVVENETITIVANEVLSGSLKYPVDDETPATNFKITTAEGVEYNPGKQVYFQKGINVILNNANINAKLNSVGDGTTITLTGNNTINTLVSSNNGKLATTGGEQTINTINGNLDVTGETLLKINAVPSISLNNATLAEGSSLPATIDVVVAEGENNIINQALTVNSFTVAEGAQVTVNKKVIACTDKDSATAKVEINGKLIVDNGAEFIQEKNKPLNFNGAEITVQQGSNLRVVKPEFSGDVKLNVAGTATFSDGYNPVFNEGATVTLEMYPIHQEGGTFISPSLATRELANLTTSTEAGYKIIYHDGAYIVVDAISDYDVAKNEDRGIGYQTLFAAINDVQDGETIAIIRGGTEPLMIDIYFSAGEQPKNFTIKGGKFEGGNYITDGIKFTGNVNVTFEDAYISSTLYLQDGAKAKFKGVNDVNTIAGNTGNTANIDVLDGASLTIDRLVANINVDGNVTMKIASLGDAAYGLNLYMNNVTLNDASVIKGNVTFNGENSVGKAQFNATNVTVAEGAKVTFTDREDANLGDDEGTVNIEYLNVNGDMQITGRTKVLVSNKVNLKNATISVAEGAWIDQYQYIDYVLDGTNTLNVDQTSKFGVKYFTAADKDDKVTFNVQGEFILGNVGTLNKADVTLVMNPYNIVDNTFSSPEFKSPAEIEGIKTESTPGYKIDYQTDKYHVVTLLGEDDVVWNERAQMGYESLQAALAEVQSGDVIVIQDKEGSESVVDYTYTGAVEDFNFTIKTNGPKYKVSKLRTSGLVTVNIDGSENAVNNFITLSANNGSKYNINGETKLVEFEGAGGEFNLSNGTFEFKHVDHDVNVSGEVVLNQLPGGTNNGKLYMHNVTLDENTVINGANVVFAQGENTVNGATFNGGTLTVNEGITVNVDGGVINYTSGDQIVYGTLNVNNVDAVFANMKVYGDFNFAKTDDTENNYTFTTNRSYFDIYGEVTFNNALAIVKTVRFLGENAELNIENASQFTAVDILDGSVVKDYSFKVSNATTVNVDATSTLNIGSTLVNDGVEATLNFYGIVTATGNITGTPVINMTVLDENGFITDTEQAQTVRFYTSQTNLLKNIIVQPTPEYGTEEDWKITHATENIGGVNKKVYKFSQTTYVAQVGDVKYEKISAAVTAATALTAESNVVTLIKENITESITVNKQGIEVVFDVAEGIDVVNIKGNLTLDKSVTVTFGRITPRNAEGKTINFTGDLTINNSACSGDHDACNLKITEAYTLNVKSVTNKCTITVDGALTATGAITNEGIITVNGALEANTITNNTDAKMYFNGEADAVVLDETYDYIDGGIITFDDVKSFNANIYNAQQVTTSGTTVINGTLHAGYVKLDGIKATVTGNITANDVDLKASTNETKVITATGNVTTSGTTIIDGTLTAADVTTDGVTEIKNNITATGDVTLKGNTKTKAITATGDVNVTTSASVETQIGGKITAENVTFSGSGKTTTQAIDADGYVTTSASGETEIKGLLEATGNVTLKGKTITKDILAATANVTTSGETNINGTLTAKNVTFGGTTTTTDDINATGGYVTTSGTTTIGGNITAKDVTFGGTTTTIDIFATADVTLNGNTITQDITAGGNVTLNDNTTTQAIHATGDVTTSGETNINGTLNAKDVTFYGTTTTIDAITAIGNVKLNDNTITQAITANTGDVTTSGTTEINGPLSAQNVTFDGTTTTQAITASGYVKLQGNTTTEAIAATGDVTTSGTTIIEGDITANNVTFGGNNTYSGTITATTTTVDTGGVLGINGESEIPVLYVNGTLNVEDDLTSTTLKNYGIVKVLADANLVPTFFHLYNTSTITVDKGAKLEFGDLQAFHSTVTIVFNGTVEATGSVVQIPEGTVFNMNDHDATFKTSVGNLAIGTNVTDHKVSYNKDTKTYRLVNMYVAKIGDVRYETFAAAINSIEKGAEETEVELLWEEGNDPIDMQAYISNKDVVVIPAEGNPNPEDEPIMVDWTKGCLFVGRGPATLTFVNDGDATLTFRGVDLVSYNNEPVSSVHVHVSAYNKDNPAAHNGTLIVDNSDIQFTYIQDRHLVEVMNNSNVEFTLEDAMNIGGRPYNETSNWQTGTAQFKVDNTSTLKAKNIYMGYEGIGILDLEAGAQATAVNFHVGAHAADISIPVGMGKIISEGNITGLITAVPDHSEIVLSGGFYTDVVPAGTNLNELDWVAEGYKAYNTEPNVWQVRQVAGDQEYVLNKGWNWFSHYNENYNNLAGLTVFENELGSNATIIKNQTNYRQNLGGVWVGTLNALAPESMFMINTKEAQTIECLNAPFVDYSNTFITLREGWNWIGYPVNVPLDIEVALENLNPEKGDIIKGYDNGVISQYLDADIIIDGETIHITWDAPMTLEPGKGYMYYSNSDKPQFVYNVPVGSKSVTRDNASVAYHWTNNASYPYNMNVIAMVSIDDVVVEGNYEVAAFANGELRGSARPVYVEAFDSYVVYMTIRGEQAEELTFKYYDVNSGKEYKLSNRINYVNDAVIGSTVEPYMLTMNMTDIDEVTLSDINIYPNPTTTGVQVNLDATCEKVEIFNALGVKVAEYQNVDSIDAFETAGIYVIRLTNGGEIKHTRLVVR